MNIGKQEVQTKSCDWLIFTVTHTYLKYNFLHFFIRGLKLSNENQHDFPCVVVGILSIHQWDKVTNSLQEGSQTLQS